MTKSLFYFYNVMKRSNDNFPPYQGGALTKEQALQKLKQYCAYQERCHSEVKEKLYSLGVWKKDHDRIIATLIEENYLNEERFAIAFAGGKWRMKQWGRVKIKFELKQRQVSEYCIKKALKQIDEEEYREVLNKLAEEKYTSLKKEQYLVRKKKTMDYLTRRGFEAELVNEALNRTQK
jgi:regulatory protein